MSCTVGPCWGDGAVERGFSTDSTDSEAEELLGGRVEKNLFEMGMGDGELAWNEQGANL